MNQQEVLPGLSSINALWSTVGRLNDSLDTQMSGSCCRPGEADVGSGPTASACSAERWEVVSDGYGTRKTMSGRKSTLSIRRDGFMSMHVRKLGTLPGYMPKVRHPYPYRADQG